MSKQHILFDRCVFHILHSDKIDGIIAAGGTGWFTTKGNWKAAAEHLQAAKRQRKPLCLLLDHAEEFIGVAEFAIITGIEIKEVAQRRYKSTVYVRSLQRLDEQMDKTDLIVDSSGQNLDAAHQRGYVICRTPDMEFKLDDEEYES